MSASEIQEQKAAAGEIFVQQAARTDADVAAVPLRGTTIYAAESRRDYTREATAEDSAKLPILPCFRQSKLLLQT